MDFIRNYKVGVIVKVYLVFKRRKECIAGIRPESGML